MSALTLFLLTTFLLLSANFIHSASAVDVSLKVETVASNLDFPVSIAFSPDGRLFFNERTTGRIRIIQGGEVLPTPFAEVPIILIGETGLLGLALHPDFMRNPFVYVYHTYRDVSGIPFNRVIRFRDIDNRGEDMQIIIDRIPAGGIHNGGQLEFGPDGKLYVSTGETGSRDLAQDLSSLGGKVLRANPDGSIPADNPFAGSPVFSLGHRNIFGMAFHPLSGKLYITENGPSSNDEINIVEAGKNYGWPLVLGVANDPRFVDPILTYTPNIAPTDATFYTGDKLPSDFRYNLLFGAWNTGDITRVVLKEPDYRIVVSATVIFHNPSGILDVEDGPDGYLYFTDSNSIMRLVSIQAASNSTSATTATETTQPTPTSVTGAPTVSGVEVLVAASLGVVIITTIIALRKRR